MVQVAWAVEAWARVVRGRGRNVRARIDDGRSRTAAWQAAAMTFVDGVPCDTSVPPVGVATRRPVWTATEAQG